MRNPQKIEPLVISTINKYFLPIIPNKSINFRNRFANAFSLSEINGMDQKDASRGDMMAVCNDCRGLVVEIMRSSKQTRTPTRDKALRNLTLDLSPVYKRW